ncbi:MAG: CoA-binding protein, partial [Dehalococcoidales bacterium]
MSPRHDLDSMFHPRSVAVVGVSTDPVGWGGTGFLSRLRKLEFPGDLYPVNPKADEIQGLKVYPDIGSLPQPPDLVIVAIPGAGVPQVLRDCIAAGVKNVHIFSSGFAETGLPEGRRLDAEITEIIGNSDLHVIGPNCMGVYVPASRLTYWGAEPAGSGSLAFLSQSGGHAEMISDYAQKLGVYFSKMISFGNARGLQAVDLLEYLGDDPETRVIAVYLAGVSQGGRFTRLVREIGRTKPVLVWKGGLTESGSRAVASHTGSLAGEERIWDAFFAQTGAVRVDSREEIVDFVLAYNHLGPPRGRRVLLISGGGGNSVALADICSREGLEVPRLSESTRQELNSFIRLAGNSARNPIDAWMLQEDVDLFRRAL